MRLCLPAPRPMSTSVSRFASDDSPSTGWFVFPAAVCALCAAVLAALGLNETWFIAWNTAASGIAPGFVWAGITNLASTLGAFALITPALAWRPRWLAATLLAAPVATLYTHGLKQFFSEPRPAAVLAQDQFNVVGLPLRTDSFPSGHSLTAFVIAGVIVLCASPAVRRQWAWVVLAAAVLMCFSRVAVGAHWPLDLFAGAAGGWLSAVIGVRWSAHWRFWERRRGVQTMGALMILVAVLLAFEDLGYPEGLWMQYLLVVWGMAGAVFALVRPMTCKVPT